MDGRRLGTLLGLCGNCRDWLCAGGGKAGWARASGFPGDTGDRGQPLSGLGAVGWTRGWASGAEGAAGQPAHCWQMQRLPLATVY